ncbi:MAG: hypothetical protein EPN91_02160 [Salinibacterium sp.]|nr:MAG: hypothetical protein EPN91_02160 [Salinibacterium sp.]
MRYYERVDAVQVNWRNWGALEELMGDRQPEFQTESVSVRTDDCGEGPYFLRLALRGGVIENSGTFNPRCVSLVIQHGEFLIKRSDGTFTKATPDEFNASYLGAGT